ncbi:MAG: outer membrane protein transport protein [Deltaproteobacteria bacterium]|nr:outer membrane protein transport protein [Deltaproteobacteria bacterium]MBW1871879.1 outer membrane protein transport protein [Deltaproteobacteria bacterium]
MPNIFSRQVILSWVLIGLAAPLAAQAGGFTIIEMGAKKTGMMAGIAKPDDLSAVYHNPAGLADLHGTRLHLSSGFSFVHAEVRLKAWEQGGEGFYGAEDYIDTPIGDDGYYEGIIKPTKYFGAMPMFVASSDFGWEDGPVWAFSFYVPDFIGAFLPEDAPTRYVVVEGYFVAAVSSITCAYRLPDPVDWITVGASLGVIYVRIEGKKWLNLQSLAEYNTDFLISQVGEDYRPFYNFGVTVDILPELTVGLAFIGGADVSLKGRLEIDLAPGTEMDPILESLDLGLEGAYDMTQTMKVPAGLGLGVNWEIIPELELAFDFRYWFYGVFETQNIYHNIDIELLGEPAIENPMVTRKDYEGSWTISAGVLVKPFEFPLEFMGGGTYDHSPAPNKTRSLETPTVNLAGFGLGTRYTLLDMWRLSVTYYHYWYLKSEISNSILEPPQNSIFQGTVDTFSIQVEVVF